MVCGPNDFERSLLIVHSRQFERQPAKRRRELDGNGIITRVKLDQLICHDRDRLCRAVPGDEIKQDSGRGCSHDVLADAHRRQRRVGRCREVDVVHTDDRQIVRNPEAGGAGRAQNA